MLRRFLVAGDDVAADAAAAVLDLFSFRVCVLQGGGGQGRLINRWSLVARSSQYGKLYLLSPSELFRIL
jgi:hypothetical protein